MYEKFRDVEKWDLSSWNSNIQLSSCSQRCTLTLTHARPQPWLLIDDFVNDHLGQFCSSIQKCLHTLLSAETKNCSLWLHKLLLQISKNLLTSGFFFTKHDFQHFTDVVRASHFCVLTAVLSLNSRTKFVSEIVVVRLFIFMWYM